MTSNLEAQVGNRTRRFIELMMALGVAALGIQLTAVPGEVFRPNGALDILTLIAPAIVWTLAFTVFGTVRLVVVFINGFWPRSPTVRWGLSIISLFLWTVLCAGYWAAMPSTKGFPALMLSPIALGVEGTCLYALTVLRWTRKSDG